ETATLNLTAFGYRHEANATPLSSSHHHVRGHCTPSHVRFTPESGHIAAPYVCPLRANSGHRQRYSIISSARASSDGGTVRFSALAVFRLMTSSIFVACWTGKSSPFRIRPVETPARRN